MTFDSYNRYQAFATHLLLSLMIFLFLFWVITQFWYQGVLFETSGGWGAIKLIAGIDVIIGPVITLLIYNPAKKSLGKDLVTVALLQAIALGAGSYVIYTSRPVALVYHHPEFYTLYANNPLVKSIKEPVGQAGKPAVLFYDSDSQTEQRYMPERFSPLTKSMNKAEQLIRSSGTLSQNGEVLLVPFDRLSGSSRYLMLEPHTLDILSAQ